MKQPGWQEGVANVFNTPHRVAWWEGPPFGGGQYHAECRGDADVFSAVLKDFANLQAETKTLVVHDGVGHSFWLNPNNEADKRQAAEVDWVFVTWTAQGWGVQRGLPAGMRDPRVNFGPESPPQQIDVYVGGQIDWDVVEVPDGIVVDDQRMSIHGFSTEDGCVLQGKIVEGKTFQPLAAIVELHTYDRATRKWSVARTVTADENGQWTITQAPTGTVRAVATLAGYADRVFMTSSFDGQPRWSDHGAELVKASHVNGRVVDKNGQPLSEATVRLRNVVDDDRNAYRTRLASSFSTDVEGQFLIEGLPTGWVTLSAGKDGYCFRGVGEEVIVPSQDITLTLERAGAIDIEVDFANTKKPDDYLVSMTPVGGEKIGSWGGSGSIDDNSRLTWNNIPPGKYVVTGRLNPGSTTETTPPQTVTITAGETTFLTLQAK